MPISLDCTTKSLKLKALKTPKFAFDRDHLAKLPGRIPIYGINKETGKDEFQYWEVGHETLPTLVEIWGDAIIASSPEAKKLLASYKFKFTPIKDLPLELLTVKPFSEEKILKDYQEQFICISREKNALLCSMDIGTGKSISSALRFKNLGGKKLLIIGPAKLDKKWRADIREDLGEELLICRGTKAQREKLKLKIENFDIFYTNFEQLKEFTSNFPKFDCIIIDEIHCVCNPSTKDHKILYSFLRKSQAHILGLSATPMRHKMEDFWGVLRLIDPIFAGDKKAFLDEYQKIVATMKVTKIIHGVERVFYVPIRVTSKNEEKLHEKLKSIMFRVKKEDLDLPFKDSIEIVDVEMTSRQKSMYKEALHNLVMELSDKTVEIDNPLTKLLRLLQISEGLFNVDPKFKDSGKLDFLKEEIKEKLAAGEKVVIWSKFEPITREIQSLFPRETVIYSGKVADGLRDLGVWAFQGCKSQQEEEEFERIKRYYPDFSFKPGEAKIISGTHSSRSGMGVNFHEARLSYFTSFDPSPVSITQARGRTSRLGQTRDTENYFLVSDETIERKALRLILSYQQQSTDILDGRHSDMSKLTRQLMALLM